MNAFTVEELREVNDALCEAVNRMLDRGQSVQEREYNSLVNAWEAQKKCVRLILGDPPPRWVQDTQARVDNVLKAANVAADPKLTV